MPVTPRRLPRVTLLRYPLALAIALLSAGLGAQPAAADGGCAPLTQEMHGTVGGQDGRTVNVMLGFDILDSAGRKVRQDGCTGPSGYGARLHLNYQLPAAGGDQGDTTWSLPLPANASHVYIEAYPKRTSDRPDYGVTDSGQYGLAMRRSVAVHYPARSVTVVLPVKQCGAGTTGALVGRFRLHGRVVPGKMADAFSEAIDANDPGVHHPILGFGIAKVRGSSYRIDGLASAPGRGEAYTIIARLASGQSKQFYLYDGVHHRQHGGVHPCKLTTFDLSF